MSAKQQNREPAKQYVSKTTKQCVNTTVSCPEIALQRKRELNKKE